MRKNKGITLIALVITIIILIILAGVSISVIVGNDGIIDISKQSAGKYEDEVIKEKIRTSSLTAIVNNFGKVKIHATFLLAGNPSYNN